MIKRLAYRSGFFGRSARIRALRLLLVLTLVTLSLAALFPFAPQTPAFAASDPTSSSAEAASDGVVEVSSTGTEGRIPGANFALANFERLNKGTSKSYEGKDYGYRYPLAAADAFVLIVRDEKNALVYLPASANPRIDLSQQQSRNDFETLVEALDARMSNGGVMLQSLDLRYEYTSETSVMRGGYRYEFAVEVEPKHYYASIRVEGSNSNSSSSSSNNNNGALFAVTGAIIPSDKAVIEQEPTGFEALQQFFTRLDLRPFWVSLRTSAVAMFFVFILGLLAAWYSQRIGNRLKGVLDSLFTIPMVLPPTVCGFILLVIFGNSTPVGRWLLAHGITLIFSWPAAVLAAVVVSFPLMYRTARGAFEGLDPTLADAARTLGWPERRIFLKLMIPLAWPSIAAGTVLAFARAMGEFGATLFVAGNYPGVTQTMPIAIYFEWMGGHSDVATFWVFVVILFSFVVILFVNWYASHTQRYRRASSEKADDPLKESQKDMRKGSGSLDTREAERP